MDYLFSHGTKDEPRKQTEIGETTEKIPTFFKSRTKHPSTMLENNALPQKPDAIVIEQIAERLGSIGAAKVLYVLPTFFSTFYIFTLQGKQENYKKGQLE